MCKIENPLTTSVNFMILSLLEDLDRKKHINSLCFLMIWNLPPESPESPESPDVVSGSAAQTPPTRAGGQDDVS